MCYVRSGLVGENCILEQTFLQAPWKIRAILSILSWWHFLIYKSNILSLAFLPCMRVLIRMKIHVYICINHMFHSYHMPGFLLDALHAVSYLTFTTRGVGH